MWDLSSRLTKRITAGHAFSSRRAKFARAGTLLIRAPAPRH